jgi:hypothetical protein
VAAVVCVCWQEVAFKLESGGGQELCLRLVAEWLCIVCAEFVAFVQQVVYDNAFGLLQSKPNAPGMHLIQMNQARPCSIQDQLRW